MISLSNILLFHNPNPNFDCTSQYTQKSLGS